MEKEKADLTDYAKQRNGTSWRGKSNKVCLPRLHSRRWKVHVSKTEEAATIQAVQSRDSEFEFHPCTSSGEAAV